MKIYKYRLCLVLIAAVTSQITQANTGGDYQLIWSDEFNENAIDTTKWNHEVNDSGGGNHELQYYTDRPDNSFIRNGNLVIQAKKESYLTRNYTSARLNTSGKFSFKYGRIDVRARLPEGQGLWPAIWLLPQDSIYGGWPLSGEIDIMELLGNQPSIVHGSLNYGNEFWPNQKSISAIYALAEGRFYDDYHIFSIKWEPNKIEWFVDGNLYSTLVPHHLGICGTRNCDWRFDQNFYIILNLAVGGDWPGNPSARTTFPQSMLVSYVRVYQKPLQ